MNPVTRMASALLTAVLLNVTASACSGSDADSGSGVLEVWRHDGTDAEQRTFTRQVRAFAADHPDIEVRLRTYSEGDYNDVLQAASARNDLPDLLEIDGPYLANYVYQRRLRALDSLLPPSVLDNQLPSVRSQGRVGSHTYAVATFDSGLGLYADRRQLEAAGVAWPQGIDDAWTAQEFVAVLGDLARRDPDGRVLDVKQNYGVGEWLTYGFGPLVASAGGELIDPGTLRAGGYLDGPAVRHVVRVLQSWAPYVDPNADDDAFVSRDVALSWVGHWTYGDYAQALGEDLLVLPLPDLGHGTKTGQGSWAWALNANSGRTKVAMTLLEYLLRDREVLRMSDANGAVPGTRSALERSELYAPEGPLRIFAEQLLRSCGRSEPDRGCVAVPRPVTPGYPLLSAQFAHAVSVALTGHDASGVLRDAAETVDEDLAANRGFR